MPARQLVLLCAATFCAQLAAATPFAHAAPGWRTQLVQTEQPAGAPRELQPPRRRVARARAVYTPPPAPPASLAAPCAGADLIPAADDVSDVQSATLCLVNQERARAGLDALRPEPHLQAAAQSHSDDMVQRDYFAHTSPLGTTPLTLVLDSGYLPPDSRYKVGENLAYGTLSQSTPAQIVRAWMNSPEHRANVLDPAYRQTGLAVAPAAPAALSQGQPGGTYTQEFGTYTSLSVTGPGRAASGCRGRSRAAAARRPLRRARSACARRRARA